MNNPNNSWAKCPYLSDDWREVHDRHGWSVPQVLAEWRKRRLAALKAGYTARIIRQNCLDNPFISDLALRVIMNDRELHRRNIESRNKYGRFTSIGKRQLRRAA